MAHDTYDVIREYRSLKEDIFYPFDKSRIERFPKEKDQILAKRHRLSELKDQLGGITSNQIKQCKRNLMLSIEKAIELTSNNRLGYPLSRDQGMVIPNYVYGKVLGIVKSAIDTAQGFSYPEFYFEPRGNFDSTNLIEFLQNFKSELVNSKFESFLDFEEFYELHENKLKELWQQENKRHPGNYNY